MKKTTCTVAFLVMIICAYAQAPTVEHTSSADTGYALSGNSRSFKKVAARHAAVVTTTYQTLDSNILIPAQVSVEDAQVAIARGPQKLHRKLATHDHWYWFLFENQMETYDALSFDGNKFSYLPGQKNSIVGSAPICLVWWMYIALMLIGTLLFTWLIDAPSYLFTILLAAGILIGALVSYSINVDRSAGVSVWQQFIPFVVLLIGSASIGTYVGYRIRRRTTLKRSAKNLALT